VRDLAAAWGIASIALGEDDTGTEIGDDVSEAIIWPDKAGLVAYIRTAFESLNDAIGELTVESLSRPVHNPHTDGPTIMDMLFAYQTHHNRHLGMIEGIRGFLGLRGTAPR
jgi:hypothetical protein